MSNWTEQQARDYMTRRLASEQRARERMQAKASDEFCACGGRWRTDGAHANEFCECCFKDKPKLPNPITEAQFQALATAKPMVCPWCNLPVEKISETVNGVTFFFYRHAPDAPKCQGMWKVMEEKP